MNTNQQVQENKYSDSHKCVPTCPPIFVEYLSALGVIESFPEKILFKPPDDLVYVEKLAEQIRSR